MEFIKKVGEAIFIWPLVFLYKKGPKIFLFWEGIRDESICYELTKVDTSFWLSNDETIIACSELIERKSTAFIIAVYLIFFLYLIYTICSLLIYKHFFISQFTALIMDRIDNLDIHVNTSRIMKNQHVDESEVEIEPVIYKYSKEEY